MRKFPSPLCRLSGENLRSIHEGPQEQGCKHIFDKRDSELTRVFPSPVRSMGEGGRRPDEGSFAKRARISTAFVDRQRALTRPSGTLSHPSDGRGGMLGGSSPLDSLSPDSLRETGRGRDPTRSGGRVRGYLQILQEAPHLPIAPQWAPSSPRCAGRGKSGYPANPPAARKASSSGVDFRPNMALRWGKRPKRAMISR